MTAPRETAVTLVSRAKIDGRWRQPGDRLSVDPTTAAELQAMDAVLEGEAPVTDATDAEVAIMAQTIADAAVKAAVAAATADLQAERDEWRQRAEDAEGETRSLQAQLFELEAEIAELQDAAKQGAASEQAAKQDKGQAGEPPAAKPASKKAAAAPKN
ncbi:hypothetical protein H4P12_08430 [Paracoccus sp. 11-3]|uniref:Uncharacterized protein n=1 Tax=Paracoccus amoyensis TaxID=2760093 RepID=A0A926GEA4_9RHOB|nr:hypothetical protein [Paracoccus amoyensis]MBC9246737.1 hypothetical protein [Paracoccus amoyensis]